MRDGLKEEEAHLRWRAAGQLFRWALWWRCRAVLGLFPKRVHAHRQRQSQENLIQFMHTCSALKLLSIQLSWWVKATYALTAMRGLKCRKVISFNLSVWPDTSTPLTRFSGLKQSWAHKVSLKWLKPLQLKIPFSKHTRQKTEKEILLKLILWQANCMYEDFKDLRQSHWEAHRVAMTTEWRRRYLRAAFNYLQRRQSFNNKICAHF